MFGLVLTCAYSLVLAYVLWRAGSVPMLERRLSSWRLLAIGAGLWLIFVLGRTIGHHGTSWVAGMLELAGMTLLGWILLTATALMFVDMVTGFGLILRRWAPRMRGFGLLSGAVLSVIALVQGARAPVVSSYEVELPGLPAALADRPTGATVFLSHTPWQAERAAAAGAGMMLSGHTHGGQIWPWGYLVRAFYPYLAGRYDVDGMSLIVTRGVGTWGPPMRLWRRGEILKISLRSPGPAGPRR